MGSEVTVQSITEIPPELVKTLFGGMIAQMCEKCNGACCRNRKLFVMKASPQTIKEIIMWEMSGLIVTRNGDFLEYSAPPCKNLDLKTGRCLIYEDRPDICKEFPPGCVPCIESRKMYYKG